MKYENITIESIINYVKMRIGFNEEMIDHFIDTDEEIATKYMERRQELNLLLHYLTEGGQDEENN